MCAGRGRLAAYGTPEAAATFPRRNGSRHGNVAELRKRGATTTGPNYANGEALAAMGLNSASRGASTAMESNPANGETPAAATATAGGSPSQHEIASGEASGGKALAATACDDAPEPEAATAAGVTLLERALDTSPALARGRTGSRPLSQRGWRRARTRLRLNSLKQHMEAHRIATQGVGCLTAGQRLVRPNASFVKGALMLRISVQLHNGVVHRSSSQHSSSAPANRSTSPSVE